MAIGFHYCYCFALLSALFLSVLKLICNETALSNNDNVYLTKINAVLLVIDNSNEFQSVPLDFHFVHKRMETNGCLEY